MTAWSSGAREAAKSARKRFMATVDTVGRTRAKPSPVLGSTAA
jgi:hypothetical protein